MTEKYPKEYVESYTPGQCEETIYVIAQRQKDTGCPRSHSLTRRQVALKNLYLKFAKQ